MVTFPNCKINLGLNILEKRTDGFHNLETIFYPIGLQDVLEIITNNNTLQAVEFSATGLVVDGNEADNICIKAYHLLKKDFPHLPSIKMHLHKAIPMGAGLGGGSADGAFVLTMLNEKFALNITEAQLIDYALQLGSDCPFFIINQPCFAEGRGEKMQPVAVDLSQYQFIIVNPKIHVNTGWAFKQITPQKPSKSVLDIVQQPITTWQNELINDFEQPVIAAHAAIGEIKNELYAQSAIYASMSGSGSTVFGIFKKDIIVQNSFPKEYLFKQIV